MNAETENHMSAEVAGIPAAAARFSRLAGAVAGRGGGDARGRPATDRDGGARVSDHAATYLKYAVEIVAGVPVASVGPSVASIYGRQLRLEGAACLGISQSGQSPDIVEMMRSAGPAGR